MDPLWVLIFTIYAPPVILVEWYRQSEPEDPHRLTENLRNIRNKKETRATHLIIFPTAPGPRNVCRPLVCRYCSVLCCSCPSPRLCHSPVLPRPPSMDSTGPKAMEETLGMTRVVCEELLARGKKTFVRGRLEGAGSRALDDPSCARRLRECALNLGVSLR